MIYNFYHTLAVIMSPRIRRVGSFIISYNTWENSDYTTGILKFYIYIIPDRYLKLTAYIWLSCYHSSFIYLGKI